MNKIPSFWPGAAALSCAVLAACQTQTQTAALQCGAGGAAAAYLLCKATGHSDKDCLGAGLVVGAIGAGACYSYAAKLDKQRKELAGKEGDLDARIKYVHGLNEANLQLNADLTKRVADVTRSTDQVVAQIQQKKISADQLAKERQARDDELKAATAQATRSNEALAEVKAYRAQYKPKSPDFDASFAKQEQLNVETQQLVAQLAAQKTRV